MRRSRPLMATVGAMIAALALVVLPACGSDDVEDAGQAVESVATSATDDLGGELTSPDDSTTPSAPAGGATELEIPAAAQGLAYETTAASAPAGTVTLRMPNPSAIPHNIAVDEPQKQAGEVVEMGGVSEISQDFPAGEYEYYCSVPGHREAGMVGTLTVE